MTIRFEPVGPLVLFGLLEIVAELAFEQAVGALHLLLFAQLHAVANHLGAARLAVLARNEVSLFDGALFCKAPQAFQEQLLAFPAAQPANCFTMSCHLTFSFIHLGDQFTGWRPFFLIHFI